MTHPDYRKATLLAALLAIFNNMAGTNIILGYSQNIFKSIADKGAVSKLSPK